MADETWVDVEWEADAAGIAERGRPVVEMLNDFYASADAALLKSYIYWPEAAAPANTVDWALEMMRDGVTPPPPKYLPVMPVDDNSLACIEYDEETRLTSLPVFRWHLGNIDPASQGALLDIDLAHYARSVIDELDDRSVGQKAINRVARKYYETHVREGTRPRTTTPRPLQLACQNVIVGLAVVRQDASFDGLRVPTYLTCQVPHLAAHEADRAMAALLLCDAFQCGGTMEIRFGDHGKNARIPPALARFARTVNLAIGQEASGSISPAEARELFMAVTPMPDELRGRCERVIDLGLINPERLCFVLMSGVWSSVELDYILGTSSRAASILRGGAPVDHRLARQSELEVCRSASMIGMLHRFLDNSDPASNTGGVRVFEDGTAKTAWSVDEDRGFVVLSGEGPFQLPWPSLVHSYTGDIRDTLLCVPRGLPTSEDHGLVHRLQAEHPEATVALLVPSDMVGTVPEPVPTMVCPERLGDLDTGIERRASSLRVGRQ